MRRAILLSGSTQEVTLMLLSCHCENQICSGNSDVTHIGKVPPGATLHSFICGGPKWLTFRVLQFIYELGSLETWDGDFTASRSDVI